MKIKFNQLSYLISYFINNNMTLNTDKEYIKLNQVVNDVTFDYKLFKEQILLSDVKENFILKVTTLTIKYPQVKLLLKKK